MKFNNYLEKITGIEIYPMISLLVFILFFIAVTIYAFKANSEMIRTMEELPLDKSDTKNL